MESMKNNLNNMMIDVNVINAQKIFSPEVIKHREPKESKYADQKVAAL